MAEEVASASPLLEFAESLGLERRLLADKEQPQEIHHTFEVRDADIRRISRDQARALLDTYESAITVQFRLRDFVAYELRHDTLDDLRQFQDGSSGGYGFYIRLDKRPLLEAALAGRTIDGNQVLYLFTGALIRELSSGSKSFEENVWVEPAAPLLILVSDSGLELRGPWLSIFDASNLPDDEPFSEGRLPPSRLQAIREARERYVNWEQQWSKHLTAYHFEVVGQSGGAAGVKPMLDAQVVKLAALYTCDRARSFVAEGATEEIRIEFRGQAHVAVIPIKEQEPLEAVPRDCLDTVTRMLTWCYASHAPSDEPAWIGDRLPFIQTRVAQLLEGRVEEERLSVFALNMPYLLEGIEWYWKAFIEGKVATYLDQVQSLESSVRETTSTAADQTGELVKNLSDSILAAVAVLIGSFIAAAFKTPFNEDLFRISMFAYAGYVALFPGLIGMTANWRRFSQIIEEFDIQRSSFEQTLYPKKVAEIVGTRIEKARTRYWRWFVPIAAIYLVVTVAAVRAVEHVPEYVTNARQEVEAIPTP